MSKVLIGLLLTGLAWGQTAIFTGNPLTKILQDGTPHSPESVAQRADLICVISQNGGQYFWASRENKPLLRSAGGAYVTFTAVDGSGYIRIVDRSRGVAAQGTPETRFDYVEHLTLGLASVTYYGTVSTK